MNYSIIIPHKNSPQLLHRLLSSIPERSDIEIIVVDDYSSQNIVDFSNLPSAGNNKLRYILLSESDAKGAGRARNRGIDVATGKWLLFADADDMFITDNLVYLLDKYKELDFDLVFFNAVCLEEGTYRKLPNLDTQYINVVNSGIIDDCRYRLKVPWGKLIKRELVMDENIRFDETPVANDVMFSLKIGHNSKKVMLDNINVYNWMVNSTSITSNKSLSAIMTHIEVNKQRNVYLTKYKLDNYRFSLFNYMPLLHRAGMSWCRSFLTILRQTQIKYIGVDLAATLAKRLSK